MEWIIGILAALVAVLLIILAVYKRQIRDICRQLAFQGRWMLSASGN